MVIVVMFMVLVVFAIVIITVTIAIPVSIPIPVVVMFHPSSIPFPIARKELFTIMARLDPSSPFIRWQGPISFVPPVVPANGIPVTADPHIPRGRTCRHDVNFTRPRRRADSNSD
jgi:hypothetical protein